MKPINTGAIKWCAGEAASLAMEGGGVVGKSAVCDDDEVGEEASDDKE
jgi:hypothetical protein